MSADQPTNQLTLSNALGGHTFPEGHKRNVDAGEEYDAGKLNGTQSFFVIYKKNRLR